MTDLEADFVVVGAGSAGCVLANRLSADSRSRVVLLAAGGRDWNPWIHIPVGYFKTMNNQSVDWCYKTEPDQGLNGRRLSWLRGKVLGGSSSLNGLLYVRGQPQDYGRWHQMGNPGWGWDEVLPLFKRAEDQERGADDYHGVGGRCRSRTCACRGRSAMPGSRPRRMPATCSIPITMVRARRGSGISSLPRARAAGPARRWLI